MAKKWLVVLLTSTILFGVHSQAPVFLVHPLSINTTEGRVVEFTCVANNTPTNIAFQVNESAAKVLPSEGFNEQPIVAIGNDTLSRTLLVTALLAKNDNSRIRCQAFRDLMGANSDTAKLRIQGPLSSVVDLSYSFINSSTVTLSWSPPFTLPGTDIIGYNISATSNGTTTNYFTSNNSYYQLSLTDITDSPCYGIYVNVSGYNGLDGESTTLGGDPLNLAEVPSSNKAISLIYWISNDLKLNFFINSSDLCIGECPTHITVMVSDSITIDFPLSTCSEQSQILSSNMTLSVTRNLNYTATVSYSNSVGPFTGFTSMFNFNTYDLVSTRVLNNSNSTICIECSFAPFSTVNAGCTVELLISNLTLDTVTFIKSTDSNHLEGCIFVNITEPANVSVYIFDEHDPIRQDFDFNVPLDPAPLIIDTQPTMNGNSSNMTEPTDQTPTTDTTNGPPITPDEDRSHIIIIICIVIVVIIILIIVTLGVGCCFLKIKKKGYSDEIKRNLSDGLVGGSFTDRSPTNPPATANAPLVYAELSGFNKPHNKVEPQSPTMKQHDQSVVYSDVMIEGQPPPPALYEPTETRETCLQNSATPTTKTVITHPDEDIQEIFFHHHDN